MPMYLQNVGQNAKCFNMLDVNSVSSFKYRKGRGVS